MKSLKHCFSTALHSEKVCSYVSHSISIAVVATYASHQHQSDLQMKMLNSCNHPQNTLFIIVMPKYLKFLRNGTTHHASHCTINYLLFVNEPAATNYIK